MNNSSVMNLIHFAATKNVFAKSIKLLLLFINANLSYENEFYMQFHFHAIQSHFHKNGFTPILTLKQRHKRTQKWPIRVRMSYVALNFYAVIVFLEWYLLLLLSVIECCYSNGQNFWAALSFAATISVYIQSPKNGPLIII